MTQAKAAVTSYDNVINTSGRSAAAASELKRIDIGTIDGSNIEALK
jgi:predicted aspartyl protease